MLKTKVKVSNITNLSEARYCAGMGVDYLSFPVPLVSLEVYREIASWVTGPQFGIEIDADHIPLLNDYPFDFIEIASSDILSVPFTSEKFIRIQTKDWPQQRAAIRHLKNTNVIVELAVSSPDEATIQFIKNVATEFNIFIKIENNAWLSTLLQLPVAGFSLEGNHESKPGLKEYPLSEILEQLDVD
ncbi:MAG: hypothetical protein JST69_00810 [Bacteroidetes bacterium]|nr:hypothetical protein [Bacteroidota bacterium]